MDKEIELDKYSHRLSIRSNICYESAHELLIKSVKKLENVNHKSDNIIRSAYKYSKKNIQDGGFDDLYYQKYLKYKQKYIKLKK